MALDRALAYTERLVQEKEKLQKYRREIIENEKEFQSKLAAMNNLRKHLEEISKENAQFIVEIGADGDASKIPIAEPDYLNEINEKVQLQMWLRKKWRKERERENLRGTKEGAGREKPHG